MIRKLLKNTLLFCRPFIRLILSLFYNQKYLQGKHFEQGVMGNVWAIKSIFHNTILRLGRPMPWPVSKGCYVSNPNNITFHPDDLNNFQSFGTYFQNMNAHIYIGRGSYIAPNVGMITSNHDFEDLDIQLAGQDIIIGEKCWIGMNSMILPGVTLGESTIVGAGSVVTHSFPEGYCIIAGSPAKIIKNLKDK